MRLDCFTGTTGRELDLMPQHRVEGNGVKTARHRLCGRLSSLRQRPSSFCGFPQMYTLTKRLRVCGTMDVVPLPLVLSMVRSAIYVIRHLISVLVRREGNREVQKDARRRFIIGRGKI